MRAEAAGGSAGAVASPAAAGPPVSMPGAAAEERRRLALMGDLRCPITLEVMRDPVIAGDGHSYERSAIERWLSGHRTSPLTGPVRESNELLPNHRLRALIQDLGEGVTHGPPPASVRVEAAAASYVDVPV